MTQFSLVTGANGHVAYNLIQLLAAQGMPVRATLRNLRKREMLDGLDCEIVQADLMEPASLERAMQGVDVAYLVAAAHLSWARDPENEIVRVNIEGTRNQLLAAKKAGVRRIVYVSSSSALDASRQPLTEDTWNPVRAVPYEYSKTDAEKLALRLAQEFDLDLVSILPGAIYGPGYLEASHSTGMFVGILSGRMTSDPNYWLPVVDARDVANACRLAARKGRRGERYLVAHETPTPTGRLFEFARAAYPERDIQVPKPMSRLKMLAFAHATQWASRFTGKPAPLKPENVLVYCAASHFRVDMSKARRELGLELIPIEQTLRDSFEWAYTRFLQTSGTTQ